MFRRILHFFFGNLLFKIFAIILAVSVWLLAVMFRSHTESTTIPVTFTNLPSDLIITQVNTDKVTVTFEGHGTDFLKFLLRPPKYQINLALVKLGFNRIKLAPDELIISSPVLLKLVVPEYAEITTDILENKKISVTIPYRSQSQKGVYITNVTTKDTVILFGPQKDMDQLEELSTESLFISEYSGPEISKKLYVAVPDTKLYRTTPESISVIASVEKEEEKTFYNIPVAFIATKRSSTINPDTVQITLRSAVSKIESLQTSDIKVSINGLKLNAGEYKIPAEIVLPKGVFLVRCEPKLFEVVIK
jgi:hypothetical protein